MNYFKSTYIFAIILFCSVNLFAQGAAPSRPKLVVGIVVDQMRYDYLYRYWDKLGNNGFKKLVNQGYYCKNTHYNYVPTYTAPGHASIYTGTTPAHHGIVSNEWYERDAKEFIYCVEDNSVKGVGGNDKKLKCSPANLLSSTITDELKLFTNKKSIVIGISFKDRASILPAGHMADAAYWIDKKTGNFISSTFYIDQLPIWVETFNEKKLAKKYLDSTWTTLLPIEKYTESTSDNVPYETPIGDKSTPTFPYNLKELNKGKDGSDLIGSTPFGNEIISDFTEECLLKNELGKDDVTDFLAISFSSTDIVGHKYAPNSIEVEDTYLRLDKEIERLINNVEKKCGVNNTLFFLTADHGGAQNPKFLMDNKIKAGYFDQQVLWDSLQFYCLQRFGNTKLLDTINDGNIYFDHEFLSKRYFPIEYYQKAIAEYCKKIKGVKYSIPAYLLEDSKLPEALSFNQMGYNRNRSGDVQFSLEAGWYEAYKSKSNEIVESGTTHGTSFTYDTHVPLLWFGWCVKPGFTVKKYAITDIAPTLSFMLDIPLPNACTGKPIEEVVNFKSNRSQSIPKENDQSIKWYNWH